MPVVVTNLKPATLAEIKRLVDEGQYASPAEFLELAAVNQLQLEVQGRPQGERTSPGTDAQKRAARAKPEFRRESRANRGVRETQREAILGFVGHRHGMEPELPRGRCEEGWGVVPAAARSGRSGG